MLSTLSHLSTLGKWDLVFCVMNRSSKKAASKGAAPEGKAKKPNPGAFKPGDPRINRTKAGPGRPANRFKKRCQKMVMRPSSWKAVKRIMRNANHPAFRAMWNTVAEHGFGKPDAHLDVEGKITLEQLVAAANKPPEK